jgi:hypothetical protein
VPYGEDAKYGSRSLVQVDSSGFGAENEMALTQDGWISAIREAGAGYAYAIVEAGQFQVVIAIFKSKG